MMTRNKKHKLEKAMCKMAKGTPLGKKLEQEMAEREERRYRTQERIKSFFNYCGVGFLIILAIVFVVSALICPLFFYEEAEVTFVTHNISDAQYAYILNGSPSMHIQYHSETRSLNSDQIIFAIWVSHCWNHEKKAEIWAERGNVQYLEEE